MLLHRVSNNTNNTTVRTKTRARTGESGDDDDDGLLLPGTEGKEGARAGTGKEVGSKAGTGDVVTSTQEMRQGFTTNAPQLLQHVSDVAAMTIHEKEARRLGLASTHTTNTDPGASKQNKFFMLERLYGDNKPLGGTGEINNGGGGEPMTTAITTTAATTTTTAINPTTTTTSPTKKASRSPVKKHPPVVVTKAPISALAKQIRALFAEQERAQAQGLGLAQGQGQGLDFGLGLVQGLGPAQGQGLGLGTAQGQGLGQWLGQESQPNFLPPSNIMMPSSNGRILADMMCVNPSKSGNVLQSNATAAQSNIRLAQSNIRLAQSNASMAQSNNRQSSSLSYLPSIHPPQGNNKSVGGSGDVNNTGDTNNNPNPTHGATTTKGKIDSGVGIYNSRPGKGGQQGPLHRKWGLGYNTHGQGLRKTSQPRNNNNNNDDDDDDDDNVDEVSG